MELYAPKYHARIMHAWVLLCATFCATLCAGRIYYARYYARRLQHCNTLCTDYARLCFIMRSIMRNIMRGQLTLCAKCLFCTLPSLAVYAACPTPVQQPNPSFVHTHHGTAEPANATNISSHSRVEARIISRIISAHNNYSLNSMTSGYLILEI